MEIATERVPLSHLERPPAVEPAVTGIPAHGEGASALAATPRAAIDRAVAELQANKVAWAGVSIAGRRALLKRLRRDFLGVADRWAAAQSAAAGLPNVGEPALTGPYFVLRNLRLLDKALADIAVHGAPRIPGAVRTRAAGPAAGAAGTQVVARIFPQDLYDRLFYTGVTAEVWMEPGVTPANLAATQAVAYQPLGATVVGGAGDPSPRAGVALVLGAGNVSSIGPMDALYKLFVENRVVLYKAHPVNAFLGPLLEEGFRALGEAGFFRVVYGGAEEGAYLCAHAGVDEIHITGSDKTYEAIVFGPGAEGRERKARRAPRLGKPISSELGNVSPVIVVPDPRGRWSDGDLAYQAENLVSMLTNNAGFNCNATRMVIQHASSPDRERLLAAVRQALSRVPARRAYYPGAAERYGAFVAAHPNAERFGAAGAGYDRAAVSASSHGADRADRAKDAHRAGGTDGADSADSAGRNGQGGADILPWTLIPGLDAGVADDICFTTEAFCGVFGETPIAAPSVAEYVDRAVDFANDTLWGTLNVTLLVSPAALADPAIAAAVERAVANLRYGTVSINHWAALGYGLVVTPWGAYPGHTAEDIQSGTGVVHNTLMFSRVQKSVVRAPFHVRPKPVWFAGHRTADRLTPKLVRFEAEPSLAKLPGIFSLALRG